MPTSQHSSPLEDSGYLSLEWRTSTLVRWSLSLRRSSRTRKLGPRSNLGQNKLYVTSYYRCPTLATVRAANETAKIVHKIILIQETDVLQSNFHYVKLNVNKSLSGPKTTNSTNKITISWRYKNLSLKNASCADKRFRTGGDKWTEQKCKYCWSKTFLENKWYNLPKGLEQSLHFTQWLVIYLYVTLRSWQSWRLLSLCSHEQHMHPTIMVSLCSDLTFTSLPGSFIKARSSIIAMFSCNTFSLFWVWIPAVIGWSFHRATWFFKSVITMSPIDQLSPVTKDCASTCTATSMQPAATISLMWTTAGYLPHGHSYPTGTLLSLSASLQPHNATTKFNKQTILPQLLTLQLLPFTLKPLTFQPLTFPFHAHQIAAFSLYTLSFKAQFLLLTENW